MIIRLLFCYTRSVKNTGIIKILIVSVLLLSGVGCFFFEDPEEKLRLEEEARQQRIAEISEHYSSQVVTQGESALYDKQEDDYVAVGKIGKGEVLDLATTVIDENTEYFYSESLKTYLNYQSVLPDVSTVSFNDRHLNYIPFDQSIKAEGKIRLYNDNYELIYELPSRESYPILIKEDEAYGIDYNGRLLWVLKSDEPIIESVKNSTKKKAKGIRVLCYHQIYKPKVKMCYKIICHSTKQMSSHFGYLKKHNYFTMSMQEVLWFIDGKINVPYKSTCLTFDDGGKNTRYLIELLEKYDLHGTLFLIGKKYKDYMISDNLELQAHTYNFHTKGHCGKTPFGAAHMCKSKKAFLADLIKDKELTNAIAFAYPYYEYNKQTIKTVKEAGFLLAFEDNHGFVRKGSNKFTISRFTFVSSSTLQDLKNVLHP